MTTKKDSEKALMAWWARYYPVQIDGEYLDPGLNVRSAWRHQQVKLDIALEALQYYATWGNWMEGPSSWEDRTQPCSLGVHTADSVVPAHNDGGQKALDALASILKPSSRERK